MSDVRQVTPSGSIGKQVFTSSEQVEVEYVVLDAPTSAATVEVREADASGTVKMSLSCPAGESRVAPMCGHRFDTGMHVEVIGVGAKAYLVIE